MAARRNSRQDPPRRALPWGPMLLSFAVGAFVVFLWHLKDNVPADQREEAAAQSEQRRASVEPTFDFYTLLPETEVVVENRSQASRPVVTSPPQPPQTQAAVPATEPEVSYMIQVGSFRKMSDADGFRARLAFLGIESRVQTVTIDEKETWHRVQIGPIVGREKADAVQRQLRENDIDSLLLRAKHG